MRLRTTESHKAQWEERFCHLRKAGAEGLLMQILQRLILILLCQIDTHVCLRLRGCRLANTVADGLTTHGSEIAERRAAPARR